MIDWLMELVSVIGNATIITTSGSLFIGLCLYIGGMVTDVEKRISSIAQKSTDQTTRADHNKMWSIYVNELRFHNEIIRYVADFFSKFYSLKKKSFFIGNTAVFFKKL